MAIFLGALVVVPLVWVMIRIAKFSAPITACLGLTLLCVGVPSQHWELTKFAAGLFVFSSVLFILGGGMKGR
jgi:hypothetical protein